MEEVQIIQSGFKTLVQEDLTKRHKVQNEFIDFQVECKAPARAVVERKVEDVMKGNAASEYKNTTIKDRERDAPNTTAMFDSGEKEICDQSKEQSKTKEGREN